MHVREMVPLVTNTWIFIDFDHRVKKGSKKLIKIMHRDLVLWRTQSGTIGLLDAYCPHMGADLSYGTVRGEVLECNFHKKCFTPTGKCQKGPAANYYPIQLSNNMIFAWFGTQDPTWEMPDFLSGSHEKPESKWKIFRTVRLNYDFHPRSIGENSVDVVHFKTFHKICITYKPVEILEITDHSFTSKITLIGNPLVKHETDVIELIIETIGACTVVVNASVQHKDQRTSYKFIYFGTPLQKDNTNFVMMMAIEPKLGASVWNKITTYLFARFAFFVQIWEFRRESKKVFMPKSNFQPNFAPSEEALKSFYDWYSRFYSAKTNLEFTE